MLRLSLAHLRRREAQGLRTLQVAEAVRAVAHARLGGGRGDVDALRVALLAGRVEREARRRWQRAHHALGVRDAATIGAAISGRRSVSSPAGAPTSTSALRSRGSA